MNYFSKILPSFLNPTNYAQVERTTLLWNCMTLSSSMRIVYLKMQPYMFLYALILLGCALLCVLKVPCVSPHYVFPFPTFHFTWFLVLPLQNSSTKFYPFHTRTHTHTRICLLSCATGDKECLIWHGYPRPLFPSRLPTIVSWGLSCSSAQSSNRCSVIKCHRLPTTYRLYIKYRPLLQPSYKYYIGQVAV